ncbi:MAG: ribonuclease R [Alphaproteobacteria bacterium]|nr:ribonuclease R [Alphaproteobacteria bacterium]
MTKKEKKNLPSMKDLTAFLKTQSGSFSKRDIARQFNIKGDDRIKLKQMLKELRDSGTLERDKNARSYKLQLSGRLPEHCQLEITGQDSMGELLARPLEWQSDLPTPQILITKNKINPPAGVGDIVQAKVRFIGNLLYEGTVLRRISAGDNNIVGMYFDGKVYAVDRRLSRPFLLLDVPRNIHNKDLVVVDIPMIRSREPIAKFVKKIGSADEPFAATLTAIFMHRLPVAFSEQSEKQAQQLKIPEADKSRVDLRHIPFVTIDGADARDFDDAVWAEPDTDKSNMGGFHIMVGIADVAWYVQSGSALDRDAWTRGNSVYFPDRVIPMLPFELSNGVCSLKPNEPRAALVCEVWIDKNGNKKKHTFKRALIQSVQRLTYEEVQNALDKKQPIIGLEKEIETLKNVYLLLKKQREKRGVIEIDVPEQEVKLNKNGVVTSIQARQQTESMQLIEELMIMANVAAAETLEEKGKPTMYRIHDRPSLEKIHTLNNFLKSMGLQGKHLITEHSEAVEYNNILKKTQGSEKDFAINEFMLRSQSQAQYSPENIGHFGLASMRYAHFTSPIRRYADIMVHRAIISALKLGEGGLTKEEEATFSQTAQHISYTERQAASAEQDSIDRYIAGYLKNKVNEKFIGRISSITSFGLFVRLMSFGIDGFVPFKTLSGDYYEYDDEKQILIGRSRGKIYRVGDKLTVILKECNPLTGSLILQPLEKTGKNYK